MAALWRQPRHTSCHYHHHHQKHRLLNRFICQTSTAFMIALVKRIQWSFRLLDLTRFSAAAVNKMNMASLPNQEKRH